MNRSPGLQLRQVRRRKKTLIAPGWSPALQFRGSWPQCMRRSQKRLSMNLVNQGRLSGWLSPPDASHSPKFSICTLAVEAGFSKD